MASNITTWNCSKICFGKNLSLKRVLHDLHYAMMSLMFFAIVTYNIFCNNNLSLRYLPPRALV